VVWGNTQEFTLRHLFECLNLICGRREPSW
jgi:hypothetical protein